MDKITAFYEKFFTNNKEMILSSPTEIEKFFQFAKGFYERHLIEVPLEDIVEFRSAFDANKASFSAKLIYDDLIPDKNLPIDMKKNIEFVEDPIHATFNRGTVYILTGKPGLGKISKLIDLMLKIMKTDPEVKGHTNMLYISTELSVEEMEENTNFTMTGPNAHIINFTKKCTPSILDELKNTIREYGNLRYIFIDDMLGISCCDGDRLTKIDKSYIILNDLAKELNTSIITTVSFEEEFKNGNLC